MGQAPSTGTAAVASAKQRDQANDAFLAGARLLDRQDYAGAAKSFAKAAALIPSDRRYAQALVLAQEDRVGGLVQQAIRQRLLGHGAEADRLVAEAHALAPDNPAVLEHEPPSQKADATAPWLAEPPAYAGAVGLRPEPVRASFHIRADLQDAIRQVAAGYKVKALFDDSAGHATVKFDLEGATYAEAMPLLLQMGQLFATPLDTATVLLAKDTPENRLRLERQMQETIRMPGLTAAEMTDLLNVVRNVFEVRQVTTQPGSGTIILRAPEDTLRAVNLTLADLLDGDSEVLLDLKLYSVDLTHSRTTGVSVPQQIGAYNVASQAQSLVSANQTVVNQAIAQGLIPATASILQIAEYLIASGVATSSLLSSTLGIFGGGITTTGVYATGGVTLNFGLTSSEARALDSIQLRVSDHKEGTFRVGSRYPITTSTYSSGVTATASSLAGVTINGVSASSLLSQYLGSGTTTTVPQIQYEDLGLTLKATPTIMKTGDVNLKMDLKIEALAGGALDNIPILANRQLVSSITVRDGETAMLLSNLNRSEARSLNGLPGLSELPGFQSATDQTVEADSSQLVLLLTPHVVRRRSDAIAGPRIAFVPAKTAGGEPR